MLSIIIYKQVLIVFKIVLLCNNARNVDFEESNGFEVESTLKKKMHIKACLGLIEYRKEPTGSIETGIKYILYDHNR